MTALVTRLVEGIQSPGIGYGEGDDCELESPSSKEFSRDVIIVNVLGYIPGVSLIIGIARILFQVSAVMLSASCEPLPFIRGIVEVLGLGILFLPFDLFASRHYHLPEDCY